MTYYTTTLQEFQLCYLTGTHTEVKEDILDGVCGNNMSGFFHYGYDNLQTPSDTIKK